MVLLVYLDDDPSKIVKIVFFKRSHKYTPVYVVDGGMPPHTGHILTHGAWRVSPYIVKRFHKMGRIDCRCGDGGCT